jgi:hypothetical protein
MIAEPGTGANSTEGCSRSRTDWLVLPTNRHLSVSAIVTIRQTSVTSRREPISPAYKALCAFIEERFALL